MGCNGGVGGCGGNASPKDNRKSGGITQTILTDVPNPILEVDAVPLYVWFWLDWYGLPTPIRWINAIGKKLSQLGEKFIGKKEIAEIETPKVPEPAPEAKPKTNQEAGCGCIKRLKDSWNKNRYFYKPIRVASQISVTPYGTFQRRMTDAEIVEGWRAQGIRLQPKVNIPIGNEKRVIVPGEKMAQKKATPEIKQENPNGL